MWVRRIISWYVLLICAFLIETSTTDENRDCDSYENCNTCLQDLGCAWCIGPITRYVNGNEVTKSHCMAKEVFSDKTCPPELQVNPKSHETIITERPLQSFQDDPVQITPQKIKLRMRLGEEREVNFQYAQAKNYPIDLYYIMDYSASMEDHRKKLAKLGNKLAETMEKITSNFRIGFGTFVDKLDLPFVSTVKEKLISPCTLNKDGVQIICVSPYSFKNHLSLSTNHKKFSYEVSQAQVSGNLDTPEGGFDAIMQAIVCKKEIGWRDKARHLLVFSTDADFHIAGDGKLAGVVEPNDAKCHMNGSVYSADRIYDYPSISQLNYVAKKNNINLIFAIVKSKKDVLRSYESLANAIENSNVGALDDQSDNVIDLVLDNYNKIVDSVVIDVNSTETIEVKISSNCSKKIERGCSDIRLGEEVNFTAKIKPITCKNYNGQPITIILKPEGIDESVIIEIDIICSCNCETPGNPYNFPKSPECSNVGDLVCGVCNCPTGRHGSQCECDGQYSRSSNDSNCTQKPGSPVCSGSGICKCGKCECSTLPGKNEKFSGKFCQCDNYSCEQINGLLCGGRGECSCGTCICNAGWDGNACECLGGNAACIREGHAKDGVCSGRGTCKCGRCECSDISYTGRYCEECPTCKNRCKEIKDCVECKIFKSGPLKGGNCDIRCTEYRIEKVDKINEDELEKGETRCRSLDEKDCNILYKYIYDVNKNLIIQVQKTKSCPPNALVWTLAVIGTILLAGLIMLLIWKIFTSIHDKREYVKFENERKNLKWHRSENPLYKDATTTFQNPFYKS